MPTTLVPIIIFSHPQYNIHDCTSPASFPGSSSAFVTEQYKEAGDTPGNEAMHYSSELMEKCD